MRTYSLAHLSDDALDRDTPRMAASERAATAELLAYLAEFDARRRYVPAGYPSMFTYCVEELKLRDGAAGHRIHAARTARRFPAIFPAVADGRLNVSAVVMLAPYLTHGNAAGLLAEASGKTRQEIEALLARRFPRTELMPLVHALPSAACGQGQSAGAKANPGLPGPFGSQGLGSPLGPGSDVSFSHEVAQNEHAPGRVDSSVGSGSSPSRERAPGLVEGASGHANSSNQHAPGRVPDLAADPGNTHGWRLELPPQPPSRLTPIAAERFALQVTIDGETRELLRQAQDLLGHSVPSGDLSEVLKRALGAYVAQLEKRRFAATDRPRAPRRRAAPADPRHIPAHVKRAVWKRDGGRCTFTSDGGQRCNARRFLEFDHAEPVARGGRSTVANLRLRCRAHNQYEAERAFGAGFMAEKRERKPGTDEHAADVMAALRSLGVRGEQARRATAQTANAASHSLEDRVRAALRLLGPKARTWSGTATISAS